MFVESSRRVVDLASVRLELASVSVISNVDIRHGVRWLAIVFTVLQLPVIKCPPFHNSYSAFTNFSFRKFRNITFYGRTDAGSIPDGVTGIFQ